MNIDYSHKPPQITSVSDLITFFEGIPEDKWCVDTRESGIGRCALGHLGAAYHGHPEADCESKIPLLREDDAFVPLVQANNGRDSWYRRIDRDISSPAIRARVLAYLRSLEPTSRPSPSVLNQVTTLASVTTPCP